MKELHILFTGAGRRIELIKAFRAAALRLDVKLVIIGADMAYTAPALPFCDKVRLIVPMKDPTYIDELLKICADEKIDLVIPTIDTDLLVLSKEKGRFLENGTRVLISDLDKISLCRDKNLTGDFFNKCGLLAPKTYNDVDRYDGGFPCFIKPKDGSSSINAYKVINREELLSFSEMVADYIIQPFISGTEYTVDMFCDFDGNPIYITPRIRERVREGEVIKTKVDLDEKIIEESKTIAENFKPCGPITVQLIRDAKGDDYYIEINPRFGGGAPLSMKAGARSAEAVLQLLSSGSDKTDKPEILSPAAEVNDGAIYSRFDDSVYIDPGKWRQPVRGVIFDLDDTLYPEKDYIRSGFKAVAEYLGDLSAYGEMYKRFEAGKMAIDSYLEDRGKLSLKEECIGIYRGHKPKLSLYPGVYELLRSLRDRGVKLGIITDGRSDGQRNKIAALGLNDLVDDIIVTWELGGPQFSKPCDIAFRIMEMRWKLPFEQMVYIGDNIAKDFHAPRQLGMRTIYFKNADGIFPHGDANGMPTVESIEEVKELLRV
ncbi:MAG: HAD-IA family hydrolase [Catonella sp.]|nr:HAD-IA family hydrolase [Catonella sp.]MDY6355744.1 HAD-IA family hydrolase [Catonella sp.]